MITNFNAVNGQLPAHSGMNCFHDFLFQRAAAHVRLVGHHHEQKACLLESGTGGRNLGENFKFHQTCWRIRLALTLQRPVDDAVAVEKNGTPDFGLRTSDFGLHRVLSHLVWPTLSLGCDTNKCQITA